MAYWEWTVYSEAHGAELEAADAPQASIIPVSCAELQHDGSKKGFSAIIVIADVVIIGIMTHTHTLYVTNTLYTTLAVVYDARFVPEADWVCFPDHLKVLTNQAPYATKPLSPVIKSQGCHDVARKKSLPTTDDSPTT